MDAYVDESTLFAVKIMVCVLFELHLAVSEYLSIDKNGNFDKFIGAMLIIHPILTVFAGFYYLAPLVVYLAALSIYFELKDRYETHRRALRPSETRSTRKVLERTS